MSTSQSKTQELLEHVADGSVAECLERFRAHSRGGGMEKVGEAIVTAAEEAEGLAMSDLPRSLELTKRLVSVADALGEEFPMARTRRAWAQALAYSNRYEEALAALQAAIPFADRCGNPSEAGLVRMTRLHAYARLGRLDDAVAAGEEARAAFADSGQAVLGARAEINLGMVHWMRDDPRKAIEHYDRARAGLAGESMLMAQLQSNRALALEQLSRFSEAELAFEDSLREFQAMGKEEASAIVEGNLADLTHRQGRFHRSMYYSERAIKRLSEGDSPGDVAWLKAELAETLSAVGLRSDAVDLFNEAIPVLAQCKMAWEAAHSSAGLGRVLILLGRFAEAAASLERAAADFAQLGHATGLARVKLAQAEIAERRGQHAAARSLAHEAQSLVADRPAESILAQLIRAGIELRALRAQEAAALASDALATAERLDLAPAIADLLHIRAKAHMLLGNTRAAIEDFRRAVEQVERVRGALQADRFRAAFLGGRTGIYEDAASAMLDLPAESAGSSHALGDAFAMIEHAKSRTLLDVIGTEDSEAGPEGRGAGNAVDADAALVAELNRNRSNLNALYARLDAGLSKDGAEFDPKTWRAKVLEQERAIRDVERRMASSARFGGLFRDPVTIEQLRASVPTNAAIVEYFSEAGMLSAFVVRADGATVRRRVAPMAEVEERVSALQFQIGRAITRGAGTGPGADRLLRDANRELEALDGLLIAPIRDLVNDSRRMVFVPHGATHGVPFHALMHAGEPLMAKAICSTAPSASVLSQLGARTAARTGPILIVGVSDESIPGAEEEARAIAASVPGATSLIGKDATIAGFRALAQQASLIHVAGHARFVPSHPASSGLKLADGWCTASEISSMRLQSPVITLSGCNTGQASRSFGEDFFGLSRSFFLAGATHLVLSLWAVHDQDAKEIMVNTYARLYTDVREEIRPDAIRDGLAAAQLKVRSHRPHPVSWAAFSMLGAL